MAWIQPNSTVKILKNVPLDEDSENTLWFADAASQAYQFGLYAKYSFTNKPDTMMYQRINRNTIRIEKPADNLYDCNYLMFQNTAYGSKWFYAFIREANYINDNVTEVVYALDDVQCWMFDWTFEQCFLERQHQSGDAIGANLVPEELDVDDYIFKTTLAPPSQLSKDNCKIVVSSSFENGQGGVIVTAGGGAYRGVYSGCDYLVYDNDATGQSNLEQYIKSLYFPDQTDSILNVFLCPTFLVTVKDAGSWLTPDVSYARPTNTGGGDGVLGQAGVRNNKLLTYPYTFLYVTDYRGMGKAFPYEYFQSYWNGSTWDNSSVHFKLDGDFSAKPTVTLLPMNYKNEGVKTTGNVVSNTPNKDELLTSGEYPQLTFNVDAFKAMLAQTLGVGALIAGGAALALGGGAAMIGTGSLVTPLEGKHYHQADVKKAQQTSANLIDRGTSIIDATEDFAKSRVPQALIASSLARGYKALLNPIEQRGNQNSTALFVNDCMGFGFGMKQVRPETLSRLDDYFTMYGYAQKRIATPNIHVRSEWTYVKTIGCEMHGNLPSDAIKRICRRFDNGIRFWTDRTKVGDYNRNNPTYTPPI